MKRVEQSTDVRVYQGSLNYVANTSNPHIYMNFIAEVVATYSDRLACDIITPDGQTFRNVPMLTKTGLVDDKPYGEVDLPNVGDYVIVSHSSRGIRKRLIIGSFVPYLSNEYNDNAVNSDDKQFTKKLLEEDKENHYKRIFKSGTSVEVEEDGTIIVEVPSGTYIKIDEENAEIHIEDPNGNISIINEDGIDITDANDNHIVTSSDGIVVTDTNNNSVTMDSSGTVVEDSNGNNITMGSSSVTINGNLEVLQ